MARRCSHFPASRCQTATGGISTEVNASLAASAAECGPARKRRKANSAVRASHVSAPGAAHRLRPSVATSVAVDAAATVAVWTGSRPGPSPIRRRQSVPNFRRIKALSRLPICARTQLSKVEPATGWVNVASRR